MEIWGKKKKDLIRIHQASSEHHAGCQGRIPRGESNSSEHSLLQELVTESADCTQSSDPMAQAGCKKQAADGAATVGEGCL